VTRSIASAVVLVTCALPVLIFDMCCSDMPRVSASHFDERPSDSSHDLITVCFFIMHHNPAINASQANDTKYFAKNVLAMSKTVAHIRVKETKGIFAMNHQHIREQAIRIRRAEDRDPAENAAYALAALNEHDRIRAIEMFNAIFERSRKVPTITLTPKAQA